MVLQENRGATFRVASLPSPAGDWLSFVIDAAFYGWGLLALGMGDGDCVIHVQRKIQLGEEGVSVLRAA